MKPDKDTIQSILDNRKTIENLIGHTFTNEGLLIQAFTRRSYSRECGGEDNEILEFAGDKVLDIIVTKNLLKDHGALSPETGKYNTHYGIDEGVLTEKRKIIVEKRMLSARIEKLGLYKYLILGKGDKNSHAENQPSVKEDLFEAILGSVALDTNWDFTELERTVEKMIDIRTILASDTTDLADHIGLVHQWNQKTFGLPAKFHITQDGTEFTSSLTLETKAGTQTFTGSGANKKEASEHAAKAAYAWLKEHDFLAGEHDIVTKETLTLENAVNRIQELAQKGFCSEPDYAFKEGTLSGAVAWNCTCTIESWNLTETAAAKSKKDAKKAAAYSILSRHLG